MATDILQILELEKAGKLSVNERNLLNQARSTGKLEMALQDRFQRAQQTSISPAPEERRLPPLEPSGLEKFANYTESARKVILPIAGSIAGEAVMGKFAPASKLINLGLRTFGSGAGAIGGAAVDELSQGRLPTEERLIGEGLAGGTAPGIGAVAKRVFRPVRTMFEPFLKTLSPHAKVVNENLKRYGENLIFSQATTSRIFNVAENVSRAALTSISPMERKLVSQAKVTEQFADDLVKQYFGGRKATSEEVGNMFITSFNMKEAFNAGIASESYKILDELSGNAPVVNYGEIIKSLAGKKKSTIELFNAIVTDNNIKIGQLRDSKGKYLSGRGVLFSDAKTLRTEYLETARRMQKKLDISPTAMAEVDTVIKAIDNQMRVSAQKGKFIEQFNIISQNYARFRETFHNDFIKALVKEDPSVIGQKVASIKTPEDVRRMKRAITPDALEYVQGAYLTNLMERASSITKGLEERGTAQVMGKSLKDLLKLKDAEMRVRNELFENSPVEESLRLLADQMFLIQEKQSAGLGAMAVQLSQARAVAGTAAGIGGILTGNPTTGLAVGGMIFLGPVGLQKLLMSKKGMDLLLEGLPLETGTSEAAKAVSRIALFLGVPREEGIKITDIIKSLEQKRLQGINPRMGR
jgi:hypothetical protein